MGYRYNPISGQFDIYQSGGSSSGEITLNADTGSATSVSGVISLIGTAAQGISSSASGSTVTLTVESASTTQKGVVELATNAEAIAGTSATVSVTPQGMNNKLGPLTQYGVGYGNGSSAAISWTGALTDGQLVIGRSGSSPAAADLTSSDSSIIVTPGANTLDITVSGSFSDSFVTDSGTAVPSLGVLTVSGGTLINTAGTGSTVTINADDTVVASVSADTGSATPSSNAFTIAGGTGCSTSGATSVITINLDASVPTSFPTDSGTATPSANALTVAGGTLINTSGSGSTVTVNADGSVVASVASDSGTATPSTNSFTIAGGTGISTSASGSTVTVAMDTLFTWQEVTGTSQSAQVNTGYVANNAALVTITLPTTASIGDVIRVVGKGAGLWKIAQNASQTIYFADISTTTGVGGSVQSTEQYSSIAIVCTTANNDWTVISSVGNFIYV